ncbi:5475_t:CDS:2 [Paraglomus brasilianum]|uniref:5475_t:CDS:1 n=1 Tax=Paraglomus brasilianum TaxID=144538 RepID=A0A9N9EXJ1_9GLOM|nr:5475_t:CDS:2 [Paraglomus brasilianum]
MCFIVEHVQKLNADIETLFNAPNAKASLEYLYERLDAINVSDINESTAESLALLLKQSILDITLDKNTIPTFERILCVLDAVGENVHKYWKINADNDNSRITEGLKMIEWMFLAKVLVAVYANVLEKILDVILPLYDDICYWQECEGRSLWILGHFLQTTPHRVYGLSLNVFHNRTSRSLSSILSSTTLLHLFPSYLQRHYIAHPSLNLLSLTKLEVKHKKKILKNVMDYYATILGLLVGKGPEFEDYTEEDKERVHEIVAFKVMKGIVIIEQVLFQGRDVELEKSKMPDAEDAFSYYEVSEPPSFLACYTHIRSILTTHLPAYCSANHLIHTTYGRPSAITRYWLPSISVILFGTKLTRYVTDHQQKIKTLANNAAETIEKFWADWVWQPVVGIIETIRHRERRLAVMGKNSLKADLESLERMVIDFAKKNYNLTEEQFAELAEEVREGDLSIVLRAYEIELQKPLRSVVQGKLLRTFLIQIQKTKVDLDTAMSALDKLLKSNELNFAFLAVGPSLFIVYIVSSWLGNRLLGIRGWWAGNQRIRVTLGQLERVLIREDHPLYMTEGLVLAKAHLLHTYGSYLPKRRNIRAGFLEDVGDLEDPNLSPKQKLLVCERMWRYWSFLRDDK